MKTLTSNDSPIRIIEILPPSSTGGWLAISLAPGKKTQGSFVRWRRDLAQDLDRLHQAGVETLVPLLEDEEMKRLEIGGLVEQAQDRGMGVLRFPFHDGGIPPDMSKFEALVRELLKRRSAGERILVHCNGGLGRAGTLAACARLALGLDQTPEHAIAAVRHLRSRRAIETAQQEEFIARFHEVLCSGQGSTDQSAAREVEDRKRGAWFGLAVGDALGAPVEFMSAQQIQDRYGLWTEMAAGGPWAKGEWTDDTALAIAAAMAYSATGFDLPAMAQSLVDWLDSGPKDVGNQTQATIELLRQGIPPTEAGQQFLNSRPGAAGNGSLMRAQATALVRQPDDPRLRAEALAISAVTHADERCTQACVAYDTALASLIHSGQGPDLALKAAAGAVPPGEVAELVQGVIQGRAMRYDQKPIGYVLLCLEMALVSLRDAQDFQAGLIQVVNRGGDTDTNGAVAGALLGARFGYSAIPGRWLNDLALQAPIQNAYDRLLVFGNSVDSEQGPTAHR